MRTIEWTESSAKDAFLRIAGEYSDKGIYLRGKEVEAEYKAGNLPSPTWIKDHLGGLTRLRTELNLPVSLAQWKKEKGILPPKILKALERLGAMGAHGHISRRYWQDHRGSYASASSLEHFLGTWNEILEMAGVSTKKAYRPGWSKEAALKSLIALGKKLKRPPTGKDVDREKQKNPGSIPCESWFDIHFDGTYPAWVYAMKQHQERQVLSAQSKNALI